MAEERTEWTEDDSQMYRERAAIAVPARDEQIATILSLLPFQRNDTFQAIELGCGEGALSFAILDCFLNASVLALDGSESMREQAQANLQRFGDRFNIAPFDMVSPDLPECGHQRSGGPASTLGTVVHRGDVGLLLPREVRAAAGLWLFGQREAVGGLGPDVLA